jgi:hypothetical protein
MVHRLTPVIQPPGVPLPADWMEKWRVLDDSFEITVKETLNKFPIALSK